MKFQTYLTILIGLAILTIVGFSSYYVIEKKQVLQERAIKEQAALANQAKQLANASSSAELMSKAPTVEITFTESDEFTQAEQIELLTKIVEPYLEYYNEQYAIYKDEEAQLSDALIQRNPNKESIAEYPFTMISTFKSGKHVNFIIAATNPGDSTKLDWWNPDCGRSWKFSDIFKKNYPEIVAKTGK